MYSEWLRTQSEKRGIEPHAIQEAVLEIDVAVKEVSLRSSYGHRFTSAHFFFDCHSRLSTDEKTYVGHMAGDKKWGFDWYYEKLHGELPDVWPSTTIR